MTQAKTFKYDHIVRDAQGKPLGRAILRNDHAYEEGKDIEISILKIPLQFTDKLPGMIIYIDGYAYQVPGEFPKFRLNRRNKDWVASSFVLQRVSDV